MDVKGRELGPGDAEAVLDLPSLMSSQRSIAIATPSWESTCG
jgi:hypothetical protein